MVRARAGAAHAETQIKGRLVETIVAAMHQRPGVAVRQNVRLPVIGDAKRTSEVDVLIDGAVPGIRCALHSNVRMNICGLEHLGSTRSSVNCRTLAFQRSRAYLCQAAVLRRVLLLVRRRQVFRLSCSLACPATDSPLLSTMPFRLRFSSCWSSDR